MDSFLATSFETIGKCFRSEQISMLAYVYVGQCVSPAVPPLCLGCIRVNNSFAAPDVLKHWKHIYLECQKKKITVISFGADRDSRLLRAMKISSNLKFLLLKNLFIIYPLQALLIRLRFLKIGPGFGYRKNLHFSTFKIIST